MNTKRLNSYQKRLAMIEKKTPKLQYVAEFKALKPECKLFFDVYSDSLFDANKFINFDVRTMDRLKRNHERFNRTKPLTLTYTFYYECDFETEDERLKIVRESFKQQLGEIYKNEKELLQQLGGELKENEHYQINITKINLEGDI